MKLTSKSHIPTDAQSMRRATNKRKQNGNNNLSSPAASSPPEFLVRIQGSDGKSEARVPIWVPLSIMAASTARNAGQPEVIAKAVAGTVISHTNSIAQRHSQSPPNYAVDAMAEIAMVSRKASQALKQAGGSVYAANAVEDTIREGGKLLAPYLKSAEAIRLDGSAASRHEVNVPREQCSLGRDNASERGVHTVGVSYEKQVSWLEETSMSLGVFKSYATKGNAFSGKEIHLESANGSRQESGKLKQQEKEIKQPHHQSVPQRNIIPTTDSPSFVASLPQSLELDGGFFATDKLLNCIHQQDDLGSNSTEGFTPAVNIPWNAPNQTVNASTLLPRWDTQTEGDSVTCTTGYTERSKLAPLMNLFLPVPKERQDAPEKSNSIFSEEKDRRELVPQESGTKPKTGDALLKYLFLPVSTMGRLPDSQDKDYWIHNGDTDTYDDTNIPDGHPKGLSNENDIYLCVREGNYSVSTTSDDSEQRINSKSNRSGATVSYTTSGEHPFAASHSNATASHNTGGYNSLSTQTIFSIQAKRGNYCDWKCADFNYPTIDEIKKDQDEIPKSEGAGRDAWALGPILFSVDGSVGMGIEMMDVPSPTSEMMDIMPSTCATPDTVQKNRSKFERLKVAFGKLNCSSKKRGCAMKTMSYEEQQDKERRVQ